MTLEEYNKKRDFTKSSEPEGNRNISNNNIKRIFVIHEHHASHLHWDLRLEIGGVLRSFAIPKDPIDINKGTKRLAISVEDHPIEYATFEGTIPEGSYGAGTVKIYDKGEFILEEEKENKLSFQLIGNKFNGSYSLVYVPNLGKNSWLFVKRNK